MADTAPHFEPVLAQKVTMEVLSLGMCRTGTQCISPIPNSPQVRSLTPSIALAEALTILGYSPIYHMREVFLPKPLFAPELRNLSFQVRKNDDEKHWVAALEAKFEGKGKPFGREEFDGFLRNWAVRPYLLLPSMRTDMKSGTN
jgi:hypothetical protein